MDSNISEEISRFIPQYPSIEDPDFIYQISKRKEFNDLQLKSSEKVLSEQGIPLLSQELQARYFSPNTNFQAGLLFHGVGTGKTCASALIVENFKNSRVGGKPRRKALVLVPNENLERMYRSQVAFQCVKQGIYDPKFTEEELKKNPDKEMSELTRERRLRASVGRSYEIVTHSRFLSVEVNGVTRPRLPNNEKIKQMYSNRVIIIDEIHNIRFKSQKKEKEGDVSGSKQSSLNIYQELHRFLHAIENCRIILLSGTPIWDQVHEIAGLMNLILPKENQLPTQKNFVREFFDNEGKLVEDKKHILRESFKGRVSFLRPMMSTANRQEIGVTDPWLSHMIIYPSAMSEFQKQYAKESLEKVEYIEITYTNKAGEKIKKKREIKGGAVKSSARDAASFVFPKFNSDGNIIGGDYGDGSFKRNIHVSKNGRSYKYKDNRTKKAIETDLYKFSSKFAAILKFIKDNPEELVFIYDPSVGAGGGVINFALALEANGYEWAKGYRAIDRKSKIKRFAAITSYEGTINTASGIEKFLESFNRPDNKYGERCQIIIGSKKIAEGITIKNIRQIHILMPHWNNPSVEQALGRVFRVGSHNALQENEKYVRVYRHAAVHGFDADENSEEYNLEKGFPEDDGFSDDMTMDLTVYKLAEEKEYYNTQIFRIMREVSWDCPLTYERNVLERDQNFTRDCDYEDCNYRCDNFPEKYIDKSSKVWRYNIPEKDILNETYNIYYSANDMDKIFTRVKDLFGVYFNLRIDMISHLIDLDYENEDERLLLLRTLDYIINSRIKIRNRYGFMCYLKEDGNIYFLDSKITVFSSYPEVTYISSPLVSERTSLEDLVEIEQLTEDKNLVKKFCKSPLANSNLLSEMNFRTIILLVEKIQVIRNKKNQTPREKSAVDEIMKRVGRNLITLPDGTVIHNMYATEYTGLGYNVSTQSLKPMGLIRVFHPKTKIWSFVESDEEEENYIQNLKKRQKVQKEIIWDANPYDFYGFRDKDGKFKIRTKALPGKRQTKGSVCANSWPIPKIYNLFHEINYLPETESHKDRSREYLLHSISASPILKIFMKDIEDRSDEELRRILGLLSIKDKKILCNLLEEWFKENNLFFDYRV